MPRNSRISKNEYIKARNPTVNIGVRIGRNARLYPKSLAKALKFSYCHQHAAEVHRKQYRDDGLV